MSVPSPAAAHYSRAQRLSAAGALRARRAWALVDPAHVLASWTAVVVGSTLVSELSAMQVRAATGGTSYGADTLAAQGVYVVPEAFAAPEAFGGFTGSGTPLDAALTGGALRTLHLIRQGLDVASAMRSGGKYVEAQVSTAISDAGRSAAGVDTFARPRTGYVRMLNPPSCARCVVLAGKFYRHNQGFLRHPKCDCIHIPSTENVAEDATTDPYEYFRGLSETEQDKAFTKAGAQAIRDGADVFQVVNSRSGMTANGLYTKAGTSKHSAWGGLNRGKRRMTPEGIYAQGLSREGTLHALERYGYILPGGQNPSGVLGGAVKVNYKTTMTAAEKRMQTARLNWEAVQQGRHPRAGHKLTPAEAARYEDAYRKTLARRGEIYVPGD